MKQTIDPFRYVLMWLFLPIYIALACFYHGKEFCGDVWYHVKETFKGEA